MDICTNSAHLFFFLVLVQETRTSLDAVYENYISIYIKYNFIRSKKDRLIYRYVLKPKRKTNSTKKTKALWIIFMMCMY